MKPPQLDIVVLGLSITSSWGNGHATTYRCLLRGLSQLGHRIVFLERDVPWYASHRDLRSAPYAQVDLYGNLDELRDRFAENIRQADLIIIGSFVPEGISVADWVLTTATGVVAFYDIDTPVTLGKLERGETESIAPHQIPRYDLYLSFTGGPMLRELESRYAAKLARPLYCAVDPDDYFPESHNKQWSLGFMGTYSADRQPGLEKLLIAPAREFSDDNFCVAGSLFPPNIEWPSNIERIEHLAPAEHRAFYNAQKFTLNLTRVEMIQAGYSPSVRLFEAAACGTPIISDSWPGLEHFFVPGREILLADTCAQVVSYLRGLNEDERVKIGERGRVATLARHTGRHRAHELERYYLEAAAKQTRVHA